MKTKFIFLLASLFIFSCVKKQEVKLTFLDEYVVKDSLAINNSIIGGLSGIDYSNGYYYLVIDDARNPRFLKTKINIKQNKIESVDFKKVIYLNDSTVPFYTKQVLDLESIFIDTENKQVNFVSEGSIIRRKSPSVFTTDSLGNFIEKYTIPNYFIPNEIKKLKHNGAFEGSSKSLDNKGFWVAMESPLIVDGEEPTFKKTSSPIRITYFDKQKKIATKQYAYLLDSVSRVAKGNINLNGLTAILEFKKDNFLIVERAYQNGYGPYGNTLRIFQATVEEGSTNILDVQSLKESKFTPLKKRLLFDFNDVKDQLTKSIVDNLEGITFGPKLENGNQSLILVSDDNFQVYGEQLNQFILLEIQN
ncbi:esterase-like activity of phytase family protein [Polaribacter sp. Z022]|uniref:esterase-like activity of phytase family protein n=1 Tax=Polaribacter sp. Z022 TaxID=2927125 RepID=UPI0020208ACC|nr:esterase-like activity of phytase family protein [Polaribacter sp. Z022]MCL7754350.1 esterase-like activity of phytase family protein [Polaribacter sp. Z022]